MSRAAPAPWGEHDLRGGGELRLEMGPLALRMRSVGEEIQVIYLHTDARNLLPGAEPHGWTRWATAGWNGRVTVRPTLPDRPVIVEPEEGFHLVGGAEARIYVRVPLWTQVDALGESPTTLLRVPTVVASDTWWGSLEEGELCYWLPTTARRSYDDTLFPPHLAMCPVHLQNGAPEPLPVEKIALRVAYLSLFAESGRIWADETRVRYHGDPDGSHLDVGGGAPPEAPGAVRLTGPRMRMSRGFRALTFARFRSLQGWI